MVLKKKKGVEKKWGWENVGGSEKNGREKKFGGEKTNWHEKKMGVKKISGVKITRKFPEFLSPPKSVKKQGNSFYFFLRNIPVLFEIWRKI